MLIKNKISTNILNILFFTFIVFASCTRQKDIVYFQDINNNNNNNNKDSIYSKHNIEYKIQSNDIIYVQVLSRYKDVSELFDFNKGGSNIGYNSATMYINGFSVKDSGNITLPILGNIYVANLTVKEAQQVIQKKIDEYLKDAVVILKLINIKYTILGEVKKPGTFEYYGNGLNILEAIGLAGDLTDYGNRKNILVVRTTNNVTETYRIDLTNSNLISSKAFYLLPNDIVYVEPVRKKLYRIDAPNISILLSSITTLILVLNYIKFL